MIVARLDPRKLPSVGDEQLDAQHRALLRMGLEAASELGHEFDAHAHRLLNDLAEAINNHFTTEERKMAAVGYPRLEDHKQLHLEVREKLADLLMDASLGRNSPVEIARFVLHWVEDHVMSADLPCAEYFARARDKPARD